MARKITVLQDPRYPAFVARYHADPLRFAVEVCGMIPSEDQMDLLVAISAPRAKVSVVSGTSTGKTAAFARIAIWHLLASPFAIYSGKVEVGSNTYIGGPLIQTVSDGLMKEMQDVKQAILNGPVAWIGDYFTITKTRVTVRGYEEQWFIAQIALAAGQSVGVAGKHRFNQLIIVDEAAGVGDDHFDVIDGTQTQGCNRTLMASQGVRSSGRFYDSHHKFSHREGGEWYSLCFNSENSPFVDADWLKNRLIETGGRDTVEYQIRVLGLFPELTDKFLIGRTAIERQIGAEPLIAPDDDYGHMIIIDVGAGVYRDKTVAMHAKVSGDGDRIDEAPRRMDVVGFPVFSNALDWDNVAGEVHNYITMNRLSNPTLVVDIGGMGEQFARVLERLGYTNIVRSQWGNMPWKGKNKKRFYNLRAQCSVHASEAVKDGRVTFPKGMRQDLQKDLLSQGSRIPYHFDEKARYHIMPKEQMKEIEGLPSPDVWDTVCMAFLEDAVYTPAARSGESGATGKDKAVEDMEAQLLAQLG
jgi:hypothetical protein